MENLNSSMEHFRVALRDGLNAFLNSHRREPVDEVLRDTLRTSMLAYLGRLQDQGTIGEHSVNTGSYLGHLVYPDRSSVPVHKRKHSAVVTFTNGNVARTRKGVSWRRAKKRLVAWADGSKHSMNCIVSLRPTVPVRMVRITFTADRNPDFPPAA